MIKVRSYIKAYSIEFINYEIDIWLYLSDFLMENACLSLLSNRISDYLLLYIWGNKKL